MKSGIYIIRCLATDKVYVGSSVNIKDRFKRHRYELNRDNHHSPHLQRAWNKYGKKSFSFEIIEEITDKSIIIEREQYWMDRLDSYNNGYNTCPTAGTMLGFRFSEESKQKLSEMRKGYKHKEETKKKIAKGNKGKKMPPKSEEVLKKSSERMKGEGNPFYGKRHSDEILKRIADSNRGRKHSDETKMKMSKARTGMTPTEETRKKLSKAKSVENLSMETRKKLSIANTGASNPNSVLNEEKVKNIKLLLKEGVTQQKIADMVGVSRQTVGLIKNNKTWTHVQV